MKRNLPETDMLLDFIRDGRPMTLRQQLRLTIELSVPAIIAQLSSIIMQYIDAAMVGRIGAEASASIGLVSTTTWLFWGLCTAAATGFSVQVAHRIGAGDLKGARMILQQSLAGTLVFSLLLAILGAGISSSLPAWLGGDVSIRRDASVYFFIFSIFLPVLQMIFLAGGMLRCSGNMRIPSLLGVIMCVLDVEFNFFRTIPHSTFSLRYGCVMVSFFLFCHSVNNRLRSSSSIITAPFSFWVKFFPLTIFLFTNVSTKRSASTARNSSIISNASETLPGLSVCRYPT